MLYIFYRPNSEHERSVTEFTKELDKLKIEYELVNTDSQEGSAKAQLYDVWQAPTAIAVRGSTGEVLQAWPGMLPTISDAGYFARQ